MMHGSCPARSTFSQKRVLSTFLKGNMGLLRLGLLHGLRWGAVGHGRGNASCKVHFYVSAKILPVGFVRGLRVGLGPGDADLVYHNKLSGGSKLLCYRECSCGSRGMVGFLFRERGESIWILIVRGLRGGIALWKAGLVSGF